MPPVFHNCKNLSDSAENSLPLPLSYAASVPYGNSFLLVGGITPDASYQNQNSIYMFDVTDEVFKLIPNAALGQGLHSTTAFMVDAQAFPEWN